MFTTSNNKKNKIVPTLVKEIKPFLFEINFKIENIYDKIQEYCSNYFVNLTYRGIDNINTEDIVFNYFVKADTSINAEKYMGPTHYLILN